MFALQEEVTELQWQYLTGASGLQLLFLLWPKSALNFTSLLMSRFHLLFILLQYTDSHFKEYVLSSLTKVLLVTRYLEFFSAFRKSDWEGVIQIRVNNFLICGDINTDDLIERNRTNNKPHY
jgi:hypothetical protein